MPRLHVAQTSPLPPPLTRTHLWAGLQRKIRFPQAFVPAITSCTILSDDPSRSLVTRDVTFAAGTDAQTAQAEGLVVREECRTHGTSWIEFARGDGSVVLNILSDGPDPGEVYLTFVFDVEGDGEGEEREQVARLNEMARRAVEKTIETVRLMVLDGRIEA